VPVRLFEQGKTIFKKRSKKDDKEDFIIRDFGSYHW